MIGGRYIKGLNPNVLGCYACDMRGVAGTYLSIVSGTTSERTWEVWLKVASVPNNPNSVLVYDSNTRLVLIPGAAATDPFKVRADVKAATTNASSTSSTTVSCGFWHHIAITYSDSGDRKVRIYVDGVEVAYTTQTAAVGAITNPTNLRIGLSDAGTNQFNGIVGELRFSNVVRTNAELLSSSAKGFPDDDDAVILHLGTTDTYGAVTSTGTPYFTQEFMRSEG